MNFYPDDSRQLPPVAIFRALRLQFSSTQYRRMPTPCFSEANAFVRFPPGTCRSPNPHDVTRTETADFGTAWE